MKNKTLMKLLTLTLVGMLALSGCGNKTVSDTNSSEKVVEESEEESEEEKEVKETKESEETKEAEETEEESEAEESEAEETEAEENKETKETIKAEKDKEEKKEESKGEKPTGDAPKDDKKTDTNKDTDKGSGSGSNSGTTKPANPVTPTTPEKPKDEPKPTPTPTPEPPKEECVHNFKDVLVGSKPANYYIDEVGSPRSCTASVKYEIKCSKCGFVDETKTNAASGHSWELLSTTEVTPVTCTADGMIREVNKCRWCKEDWNNDKVIGHIGHQWGDPVVTVTYGASEDPDNYCYKYTNAAVTCTKCGATDASNRRTSVYYGDPEFRQF